MPKLKALISEYMTIKGFIAGLLLVCVFYGLVGVFVSVKGDKSLESLEQGLASETVSIERAAAEKTVQNSYNRQNPETKSTLGTSISKQDGETPPAKNFKAGSGLYPAPVEGLYETSEVGLLPQRAENGLTPFKAYKNRTPLNGNPVISIAVRDYGLSQTLSGKLLDKLPSEVSLILTPYSKAAEDWQIKGREKGHEIWVEVPFQTESYPAADTGPQTILSNKSLKYNTDRLNWGISRTPGVAGVAVFSDSVFANTKSMFRSVASNIFNRGMGFFELNPDAGAFVALLAETSGGKYVQNNLFTDNLSLKRLEERARNYGQVVAVVTPTPQNLESLRIWLSTLSQKGFQLAPVSAIAERIPAKEVPQVQTKPPAGSVE